MWFQSLVYPDGLGILLGVGNMGPWSVLPIRVSLWLGRKEKAESGTGRTRFADSTEELEERSPSPGDLDMASPHPHSLHHPLATLDEEAVLACSNCFISW